MKRMMQLAALGALALTVSAPAMAEEPLGKAAGAIMVRARLIDVAPLVSSSSTSIGGNLSVSNTVAPEIDVSYFLTDNIAFELIAATTRHDITANRTSLGSVKVGTTWVLPPTLTAQYHFNPKGQVSPYVGAGLNWTLFYNAKPGPGLTSLALTSNVGPALQAGVDIAVSQRGYINIDVKQIFLSTNASINRGAVRAKTALDPLVAGVGFGYRF